jgi:hypothetical protein
VAKGGTGLAPALRAPANATRGQFAADGDAGDHSPFAKSLLKNFDENPRLYLREVVEATAKDVRIASRGAQVPEITTRGGSPRVCLDAVACGETPIALPAEGVIKDEAALAERCRLFCSSSASWLTRAAAATTRSKMRSGDFGPRSA